MLLSAGLEPTPTEVRTEGLDANLLIECFHTQCNTVLLMVFQYTVYHFIMIEKTKSAKNIWEPVIENITI